MAPVSGDQLLQKIVTKYPTISVIVLTGHGTVDTAVQAMHKGAYDFIVKPVDLNRLLLLIKRALRTRELVLKIKKYKKNWNKII